MFARGLAELLSELRDQEVDQVYVRRVPASVQHNADVCGLTSLCYAAAIAFDLAPERASAPAGGAWRKESRGQTAVAEVDWRSVEALRRAAAEVAQHGRGLLGGALAHHGRRATDARGAEPLGALGLPVVAERGGADDHGLAHQRARLQPRAQQRLDEHERLLLARRAPRDHVRRARCSGGMQCEVRWVHGQVQGKVQWGEVQRILSGAASLTDRLEEFCRFVAERAGEGIAQLYLREADGELRMVATSLEGSGFGGEYRLPLCSRALFHRSLPYGCHQFEYRYGFSAGALLHQGADLMGFRSVLKRKLRASVHRT